MIGLSENVRILSGYTDLCEGEDVTTHDLPYELQICTVRHNCATPFRWRWNDFFDWIYTKEDPRGPKG